jgi:23S rRNA pseudouridine2604 synthase
MCEYLDYRVVKLKRIRIMNIELNLGVGKYRDLTKKELNELNRLLLDSKKHLS